MRCPKCGYEQEDNTRFCGSCGAFLNPETQNGAQPNYNIQQQPANVFFGNDADSQAKIAARKKADNARILGIISIFLMGMILGIMAISQGSAAKKELERLGEPTGVATAGIVCGIIGLVGWVFAMIYMFT